MGTLNRERGCMSVAINVKRIGFEEKGQNEKKRSQDRSDQKQYSISLQEIRVRLYSFKGIVITKNVIFFP